MCKYCLVLGVFLIGTVVSTPLVHAQRYDTSNRAVEEGQGLASLGSQSRQELLDSGFVFEDLSSEKLRGTATLISVTLGTVVHGIGHWLVDDKSTAITLLGAQLAGMSSFATGMVLQNDRNTPVAEQLAPNAMFIGASLFLMSYLIDVFGTMYGDEFGFEQNQSLRPGLVFASRYLYVDSDIQSMRHALAGSLSFDTGAYYVDGRTLQDVLLETSVFGLTIGKRMRRQWHRSTYVFVQGDVEQSYWRGVNDYARTNFEGRFGLSLDLGSLFSHLEEVAVGVSSGYGYRVPGQKSHIESTGESISSPGYVPVEFFVHLNLTDSLHLRASGIRSAEHLLQVKNEQLGTAALLLDYQSAERFNIMLRAEYGDGFALSGGLAVWLWE